MPGQFFSEDFGLLATMHYASLHLNTLRTHEMMGSVGKVKHPYTKVYLWTGSNPRAEKLKYEAIGKTWKPQ